MSGIESVLKLPELCVTVKKRFDKFEQKYYFTVDVDVYQRGPDLTKNQAHDIADSISKYFGIIKVGNK